MDDSQNMLEIPTSTARSHERGRILENEMLENEMKSFIKNNIVKIFKIHVL